VPERKASSGTISIKDSNRYHRYLIDESQGIAGNQWIFQSIA